MNILTIDTNWPEARGEFPVGWGRENISACQRADLIWLHNWSPDSQLQFDKPTLYSKYQPIGWTHKNKHYPLDHPIGMVTAICGIANPASFWTLLAQIPSLHVKKWIVYPNHSPIPSLPTQCVMTEKDAARFPRNAEIWVLRLKLCVSATPNFDEP